MDNIGPQEATALLSKQVTRARYFFLNLAPSRTQALVLVMGGREQARPNLPSAFQPFLFARPEASDAVRAMGSGWDQSWRLRKLEDIWRDEVVLIGRMARAPADILLDGIPATDNPSRGAVLVRVLLPVVRSVELPE